MKRFLLALFLLTFSIVHLHAQQITVESKIYKFYTNICTDSDLDTQNDWRLRQTINGNEDNCVEKFLTCKSYFFNCFW